MFKYRPPVPPHGYVVVPPQLPGTHDHRHHYQPNRPPVPPIGPIAVPPVARDHRHARNALGAVARWALSLADVLIGDDHDDGARVEVVRAYVDELIAGVPAQHHDPIPVDEIAFVVGVLCSAIDPRKLGGPGSVQPHGFARMF